MASEIPDFDEDVILPTSPLSQYIYNSESLETTILEESKGLPEDENKKTCQKSINSKDRLLDTIKFSLNYIYNIFVPSLIPFEYLDLKSFLKSDKFKKILVSEDLSVLLNYESDDEYNGQLRLSYASVFQQCFQLFGFIMIYMILQSATTSNIITDFDLLQTLYDNFYFLYVSLDIFVWVLSVVSFLVILFVVAFIFINFLELCLCKILCYSVKEKIKAIECIITTIKKCMRLIQEAELIARGFTSASVPGIVERLELSANLPISSPQRQYPELRKCIFKWTKEIFLFYRCATQKLIENKMFGPTLDFSTQSLAMLDLKEFGILLRYDVDSETDLQELLKHTDDLSVSSLKTMYLLFELQISEFYKYLYLITSFLIMDDDLFSCFKKIKHFQNLISYARWVQKKQLCIKKQACESYKYYRSIETLSSSEDNIATAKSSNASNLEINVHNMSLHLKAALKRLADLEELFEISKSSNKPNDEKLVKKVEDMTKEVKSEIDAYYEYYDKCSNELQNILHSEKQSHNDPLFEEETIKSEESIKTFNVTMCNSDPNIEDEIFEAVVTKSSHENEVQVEDFSYEQQRKNPEVVGKLLHELKNVLVVKADEHRIREAKALAKKLNNEGVVSDISSEEITTEEETCESETKRPVNSELASNLSVSQSEILKTNVENNEYSDDSDANTRLKFNMEETKGSSFAASIASLALQRQKCLGLSDDICFSDGNSDNDDSSSDVHD